MPGRTPAAVRASWRSVGLQPLASLACARMNPTARGNWERPGYRHVGTFLARDDLSRTTGMCGAGTTATSTQRCIAARMAVGW